MKTIGVIGLGSIGSRHAKNLIDMGHKVLSYDPEVAPGELQDVLRGSDAVVIAAPTANHLSIMEHVLVHKKPIFVEKPIAGCEFSRAQKAVQDAADKGVPIMVGNMLRFHSCVIKAKEWLDAGKIGEPRWGNFVVAQHTDRTRYLYDGVSLNWLAHEVDLALHLLGPGKAVAASITEDDDCADFCLRHYSGPRSAIHGDYIAKPEIRLTTIVGNEGNIVLDLKGRTLSCHLADGERDIFVGKDTWNKNYIAEIQAFLDRIDGKETLGATGQDGLDTLEVILEARKLAGLA